MQDPAAGAKSLLITAGVGIDFSAGSSADWQIFLGRFPASPDAVLLCMNTGGSAPNPKWLLNYPSIQVLIRGAKSGYLAGEAKAREVMDALLGLPSQDVAGDRWVSITAASDVAFIGFDDVDRPTWSVNLRLIIEPATGTNRQAL